MLRLKCTALTVVHFLFSKAFNRLSKKTQSCIIALKRYVYILIKTTQGVSIMKVRKREGNLVDFDKQKIINAISKAGQVSDEIKNRIADYIENIDKDIIDVEEIQDIVERKLMTSSYKDVAKAYINYRYLHKLSRDRYKELMDIVSEKLGAKNVQNQNANIDEYSFGGRVGEMSDAIMKKYALDYIVSETSKNNHLNNEVYIHDLGHYPLGDHNCLSIPFDDLLANGFNTRQTDVRPAKSVNTAFQLVAVLFQLQSLQQFGGVSATHLDWTMVPYVRLSFAKHFSNGLHYCEDAPYSIDAIGLAIKPIRTPRDVSIEDEYYTIYPKAYKYAVDMTTKEVKQAVEGMYHNLNTLQSRSGNQLPFTSVNYGTCTLPEGRMIIKALLDVSIEGIGKLHKTSIFPCGIFKCKKGINLEKGDPNYDLFQLALKSTSLRLYPNYANCNWGGNAGYDEKDPRTEFSTMGCRTANGWDINGFGQLKDGRGNIAPTTIILPTIAMEADRDVEKFMKLLDKKIAEAKDSLIERFEWIASQNPKSATFMYENNTMAGYIPEEGIRSALKHGTLAIGMLGMAEALQLLIGCDHTEEKGMALAKRICQLYKDRCKEFKEKYKLNFGVYYTPAENLCHTALKKFREKYGVIPNVSDKEFFTNSMHVPVWKKMTPFEKIDIESQLTGYSSAGCITYVELESSVKHNMEALETIVKYAMEKDIPYFAVNVPNDMCMECGYTDEINDACPMCGNDDIQRLRRVTGYLTGNYTTAFNKGKQQEAELRYKHDRSTL